MERFFKHQMPETYSYQNQIRESFEFRETEQRFYFTMKKQIIQLLVDIKGNHKRDIH